jgi:hypothetical protein
MLIVVPPTCVENGQRLLHRMVKKPRGHYTARLQKRLPIARFRRFLTNG